MYQLLFQHFLPFWRQSSTFAPLSSDWVWVFFSLWDRYRPTETPGLEKSFKTLDLDDGDSASPIIKLLSWIRKLHQTSYETCKPIARARTGAQSSQVLGGTGSVWFDNNGAYKGSLCPGASLLQNRKGSAWPPWSIPMLSCHFTGKYQINRYTNWEVLIDVVKKCKLHW